MTVPEGLEAFKASEQISALRFDISSHYYDNKSYPSNIDALDPWGNPVNFKLTDKGFMVFSSGPDASPGTSDDVY